MRTTRSVLGPAAVAAAAVLTLGLTGCGADPAGEGPISSTDGAPGAAATSPAVAPTVDPGDVLTLDDGWAKAVADTGEHAMTGVFGILTNPTDTDIHVVGARTPMAGLVELHETTMDGGAMVMREAQGGFIVPAGGTLLLEPGGRHIMLMELTEPVPAGSTVEITLITEDGTEVTASVAARTFAGAEETYAPGQPAHTSTGATETHSS